MSPGGGFSVIPGGCEAVSAMSIAEIVFLCVYFGVLAVLSTYGSHRYRMAYLYYRHKFQLPTPKGELTEWPRVTVQLPIFNEM